MGRLCKAGIDDYFGLAAGEVTGDSYKEIVSGRYFCPNPGDMTGPWERVSFGLIVEEMLMVDVDGTASSTSSENFPGVYRWGLTFCSAPLSHAACA